MAVIAYRSPQRPIFQKRKNKEAWLSHKALNSVEQMYHVEVEQQADADSAQLKIRQDLCVVNGQYSFDGFDFDEDEFFNAKINSVGGIDLDAVVDDRQRELRLERKSSLLKLMREATVVHLLEAPRSDCSVNSEAAPENALRDVVDVPVSLYFLLRLCGTGQTVPASEWM